VNPNPFAPARKRSITCRHHDPLAGSTADSNLNAVCEAYDFLAKDFRQDCAVAMKFASFFFFFLFWA
jgi:hypothetical protein